MNDECTGPTIGPALVQITTSAPGSAAEKKEEVVVKERGFLSQHKSDVGCYTPKTALSNSGEVKTKTSKLDLQQGFSFQAVYCYGKRVYRTKRGFCGRSGKLVTFILFLLCCSRRGSFIELLILLTHLWVTLLLSLKTLAFSTLFYTLTSFSLSILSFSLCRTSHIILFSFSLFVRSKFWSCQ